MARLNQVLPYGKTHCKSMAKPRLPSRFDNGTTLRTNERTYVDDYLRKISSSYVSNVREFQAGFIAQGQQIAAASRGRTPVVHRGRP